MYRSAYSLPRHSWRWMVSFTLQPLYPRGRRTLYPFDGRLCGSRSCLDDTECRRILPIPSVTSSQSPLRTHPPTQKKALEVFCEVTNVTEGSDSQLRLRTKRTRHVRKFGVISWHFEDCLRNADLIEMGRVVKCFPSTRFWCIKGASDSFKCLA
jgi:hypothetical protein